MIDGALAIDGHCHLGMMKAVRHGIRGCSAEELLTRMERNGIDMTVVCHLTSPLWEREEIRQANDVVLDAVSAYPNRLAGVCVVNPKHREFAEQEARRCLALGMRGIKVHPVQHGFYSISGSIMDPIMKIAAEFGVPVVTHSDFNAHCCSPYEVAHLAARFPNVTVVMLHMGMDPEAMIHIPDIVRQVPNVVLDTSSTPDFPFLVYANPVRQLGANRVMFGSDGPVVSAEANLAKLAAAEELLGLTKEEKRRILGANAAAVYKLG